MRRSPHSSGTSCPGTAGASASPPALNRRLYPACGRRHHLCARFTVARRRAAACKRIIEEKQGVSMTSAPLARSTTLILGRPDDWHLHLRDGTAMRSVLADTARVFGRAIVMPNLKPRVATVAMAGAYRERILAARPAESAFEPLMTLYMTDNTSPAEIARAKACGFV